MLLLLLLACLDVHVCHYHFIKQTKRDAFVNRTIQAYRKHKACMQNTVNSWPSNQNVSRAKPINHHYLMINLFVLLTFMQN